MSLFMTLILGVFFIIGVVIIKASSRHEQVERGSLALAFGSMTAIAALDLFPEIIEIFSESLGGIVLMIVFIGIGILLLVGLDHFIPEHDDDEDDEPTKENLVHIGVITTIAIILHNILEGMAVYNICMSDMNQGMAVALGVGLHNIPMGMMIYSTVHHEPRFKKHLVIFLAAISTFVGGLIMFMLKGITSEFAEGLLLCVALGMIIYIIAFELLPFLLKNRHHKLSLIGTVLGFIIVLISVNLG